MKKMCKCYVQVGDDLTDIYPSAAQKEVITLAAWIVQTTRIPIYRLCRSVQLMPADRLNKRTKKVSDNTTVYTNPLNFNETVYLLHKRIIL